MPRKKTSAPVKRSVTIPYKPRFPQTDIHPHLETHRFCVLITHRQMGKTVCTINHLLKMALQNKRPAARYFYIAPLLKQAKLIAWEYIKRYALPLPEVTVCEADLSVKLPNGAKIWVTGADNQDGLRGTYADGVVLDEYAQIKPDVFSEIIRPMLISRCGWTVFCGTPKGQNQFYDLYNSALRAQAENPAEWWVGVYRADETGVISADELQAISSNTPQAIFRQEYLCDFTASADNVLIPIDEVTAACRRVYAPAEIAHAPKILGVDPARFGADRSVIIRRQGLQAFEPEVFSKMDNMALAARVALNIERFRPDAVFIDAGCGGGVIDRVRQLGFSVTEVAFGGAPLKSGQYANKRAEIWGEMSEWIRRGGALPNCAELKNDLCMATYDFDVANRMRLEAKEKMKQRCGKSPDLADALALTFALPVMPQNAAKRFARTEYDVI